ncbi:uncharacterized protein KD926_003132 [Aspergillus affinis]|uniref:uncharacterized protein n=1 Tax=Aspergillus affinis TaxID=1070780 RepID=UPI0022FE37B0|nr:uncharacterized protein KD926_003132 [Aspergillus affinis]KAI9035688.1 hypothetical protein KD926_003132 [Aspergillus affinis]
MGLFQGVFGRRAPSSNPPPGVRKDEADIEDLLDRLCRPVSATSPSASSSVGINRCNEISDILLNKGKVTGDERLLAWSERPRIYIVLRNIQRLDLLDSFVKAELTDFHIPFNEDTLPAFLYENEIRESFLHFQSYVLSSGAKGLDDHGGPHLSLAGNAQRYFYYKGTLGQGGYGLGQMSLIRELSYLKTLSHNHLVRYVASYTDEKYIAFLMQPVADYDLEKLLRNLGRAGTGAECLRPFFGCLAGAIQYLHENKIRHRDLKSRNILIKDGRVFVADFGTAYSWKGSKHSITNHRNVPYTAEYIAPEVALHQSRSTASDMWSLGVVFMEMSTVLMGSTIRELKARLHAFSHPHGTEPYLWANLPVIDTWIGALTSYAEARDESTEPLSWVRDLLQEKPNKRLKAGGLMKHVLESPSFHAFCCVDCWPVYEQRSFLYTQQTLDSQAPAPGNSADVRAQLTALLEPPVDKARESERNQTIENWLDDVGDDDMSLTSVSISGTAVSSDIEVPIRIVEDSSTAYSAESSDEDRMVHLDEISITGSYLSLHEDMDSHSDPADGKSERTTRPFQVPTESVQDITVQGESHNDGAGGGATYDGGGQLGNIWSLAEAELNVWADDTRAETTDRGPEFLANMLPSSSGTVWKYDDSLDLPPLPPVVETSTSDPSSSECKEPMVSREGQDSGVLSWSETAISQVPSEKRTLRVQSTDLFKSPRLPCADTPDKSAVDWTIVSREGDPTASSPSHDSETKASEHGISFKAIDQSSSDLIPQAVGNGSSLSRESDMGVETPQENASQAAPEVKTKPCEKKKQIKERVGPAVWISERPLQERPEAGEEPHISSCSVKKNKSKEQDDQSASIKKLRNETSPPVSERKTEAKKVKQIPPASESQRDGSQDKPKAMAAPQGTSTPEGKRLRFTETEQARPMKESSDHLTQPEANTKPESRNKPSPEKKTRSEKAEGHTSPAKGEKKATSSKKGSMSLHKQALLSSAKQATPKKQSPGSVFSPQVYMDTAWEAASTQDTRIIPINRRRLSMWKWLDRDQRILESFCTEGAVQAVRILLRDGCNPGTEFKPRPAPLIRAIKGGTYQHYKCVQELMNHDVNLNVRERRTGRTALQIAIEQSFFAGHTSLVRDLINGGADTNKPDHTGKRPILSVFDVQKTDVLEKHQLDALACLLVAGGGKETDVNVYTPHTRDSPLHLAIRRRSPMAVGLLLFRGASVNAKNQTGATPLLLAAAQWAGPLVADQETILDLLLQSQGIKLNENAGVQRRTALHQAVFRATPLAVGKLLEGGAAISTKDSEGKTARQLASELDKTKWQDERAEIIRLLDEKNEKSRVKPQ